MTSQEKKLSSDIEVTTSSPDDKRLKKTWGNIAAYPHEYLIHFRGGKINTRTSGQGARCFKYPGDTVFIIPTSLKEIIFQANQLSSDNVDIRLRGMAIYRIAMPMQIYTQLNFSNRQQAEEKLARMIGDLCRSTAKWLVANMKLEECLRKRKEDIAEALKNEVTKVVADDRKGWGVEITTIDIQDVYIQDPEIFKAMQIQFKTERLRESALSELAMQKEVELQKLQKELELSDQRKIAEVRKLQQELELSEHRKDAEVRKLQQELELSEHRKNKDLENARREAQIKAEQIRLLQDNEKAQFTLDQYRVEQNEGIIKYKQDQELDRQRQKMILQGEAKRSELEAERMAHEVEIEAMRQKTEIENSSTPLSLEKNFIETALPAIAEALARSMSNARLNIYQGNGESGTPFKFILTELMDILRERMERIEHVENTEKTFKKDNT